jgi:hypothetical protein
LQISNRAHDWAHEWLCVFVRFLASRPIACPQSFTSARKKLRNKIKLAYSSNVETYYDVKSTI